MVFSCFLTQVEILLSFLVLWKRLCSIIWFYCTWLIFSGKSSFLAPLPKSSDGYANDTPNQNTKLVTVHPLPLDDVKPPEEVRRQSPFVLSWDHLLSDSYYCAGFPFQIWPLPGKETHWILTVTLYSPISVFDNHSSGLLPLSHDLLY